VPYALHTATPFVEVEPLMSVPFEEHSSPEAQ
jgi:hypothetical protein